MKELVQEKKRAVLLRRKGYSYNDILKEVKVAKSSLSLWLKDLPLTRAEKSYLRTRLDKNISRGRIKAAAAHHANKMQRDQKTIQIAKQEFQSFREDPLFQTGIGLYWAEGAKRSTTFQFTNSDSDMVEVILAWLEKYTQYKRQDIGFRLFLHNAYAHESCEEKWAKNLSIKIEQFKKTVYKPSAYRYKTRPGYEGCLRIEVPRSGRLLLKMKTWISALALEYKQK